LAIDVSPIVVVFSDNGVNTTSPYVRMAGSDAHGPAVFSQSGGAGEAFLPTRRGGNHKWQGICEKHQMEFNGRFVILVGTFLNRAALADSLVVVLGVFALEGEAIVDLRAPLSPNLAW
jgi:hypothetical protein